MKKILIIDTTWPINSRTQRFKNSLDSIFRTVVVAWNRKGILDNIPQDHYILKSNIGYGKQFKKLFYLPMFIYYTYKVASKENPNAVFASHWDSLICATFIRLFSKGNVKVIYDCLDLPTTSNRFLKFILDKVEKFCLRYVDLTIFASRYFKPLYSNHLNSYVFENYPSLNSFQKKINEPEFFKQHKEIDFNNIRSVSWIGVVRYFDVIENILLAIKSTDIYLLVFGDGPELDKLKKAVDKHNLNAQVLFFGRYSHSELPSIYNISQCIWAAYPTNDFNAVYAISNKYFECSFFEKDIVLSQKTKMGESLFNHKNVLIIDEYSVSNIRDGLMKFINKNKGDYSKYEPDILWEDKEKEMVQIISEIVN